MENTFAWQDLLPNQHRYFADRAQALAQLAFSAESHLAQIYSSFGDTAPLQIESLDYDSVQWALPGVKDALCTFIASNPNKGSGVKQFTVTHYDGQGGHIEGLSIQDSHPSDTCYGIQELGTLPTGIPNLAIAASFLLAAKSRRTQLDIQRDSVEAPQIGMRGDAVRQLTLQMQSYELGVASTMTMASIEMNMNSNFRSAATLMSILHEDYQIDAGASDVVQIKETQSGAEDFIFKHPKEGIICVSSSAKTHQITVSIMPSSGELGSFMQYRIGGDYTLIDNTPYVTGQELTIPGALSLFMAATKTYIEQDTEFDPENASVRQRTEVDLLLNRLIQERLEARVERSL